MRLTGLEDVLTVELQSEALPVRPPSKPLVNCVSVPEASNTNGSRPLTVVMPCSCCSGLSPSAYIADCHSTPVSVVPSGLASMTPTIFRST